VGLEDALIWLISRTASVTRACAIPRASVRRYSVPGVSSRRRSRRSTTAIIGTARRSPLLSSYPKAVFSHIRVTN